MNWYSITKLADSLSSMDNDELWAWIREHGPRDRVGPMEGGEEYGRRRFFTSRYGWAVPSRGALEELKAWLGGNKVIEVGAGRGLWARLLRDMEVTVEASDVHAAEKNSFLKERFDTEGEGSSHTWTDVVQRSGEDHAGEGAGGDALMMVWPYMDTEVDWQGEALKRFGGDKLILVGEGSGGATGSTGLWSAVEREWVYDGEIDIPRWQGMHDWVQLYRRK